MSENSLITTSPTWFKISPADSSRLGDHQKVWVELGTRLTLSASPTVSGEHLQVELEQPRDPVGTKGFFYIEHVDSCNRRITNQLLRRLQNPNWCQENFTQAVSLVGTEANTCVAFLSEALRRVGIRVPVALDERGENISLLTRPFMQWLRSHIQGYSEIHEAKQLVAGDICFSQEAPGDDPAYPAHVFTFIRHLPSGEAEIVDNQVRRYGRFRHSRNLGPGPATPFKLAIRLNR